MSLYEIMFLIMIYFIIFGIPAIILIWLIISLVKFLKTPKSEPEKRGAWRGMLIALAGITTTMTICVLLIMALMMSGFSFM